MFAPYNCESQVKSEAVRERGVALIELALTLPLFLLAVLIFIWIGTVWNARSSLTSAVGNGIRLAVTRGNINMAGKALIPGLNLDVDRDDATLESLLTSPDQRLYDYFSYYDEIAIEEVFPGWHLQDSPWMPDEYVYALAYIYEGMKQSVGPNSVRYPCDPERDDDPRHGPGCLECRFLNPDTRGMTPYVFPDPATPVLPSNRLGIQCTYRPPVLILTPILNLLRMVSGGALAPNMSIVRRQFIDTSGTI